MDRLNEMKRIMDDPIYFAEKYYYITTIDEGTHLIKVYPKQAEMINAMCRKNRTIVLSARQTGKSTSYAIFALWYILTNKEKTILICANKFKTAMEILSRIQMAYQELPNWLKPRNRRMEQRRYRFRQRMQDNSRSYVWQFRTWSINISFSVR